MSTNPKVDIFGIYVIVLLTAMSVTGFFINALVFITILESRQFHFPKFMLLGLLAVSDLTKSAIIIPTYIYVSQFNLAKFCHYLVVADNIINTCGMYFIVLILANEWLQKSYPRFGRKWHLNLQIGLAIGSQVFSTGYNIGLSLYFDKILNKRNDFCLPLDDVAFIWILCIGVYVCPLLVCVLLMFIYKSSASSMEPVKYKSTTIMSSLTTSADGLFSKKEIGLMKSSSIADEVLYLPTRKLSKIFALNPSFFTTYASQTSVEGQNSNSTTPVPIRVPVHQNRRMRNSTLLTSITKTGRFLMQKISSSKISNPIRAAIIFFIISTPYYVVYICRPYWLAQGINETLFIWLKLFDWLTVVINPFMFSLSNDVLSGRSKKYLSKICNICRRKGVND